MAKRVVSGTPLEIARLQQPNELHVARLLLASGFKVHRVYSLPVIGWLTSTEASIAATVGTCACGAGAGVDAGGGTGACAGSGSGAGTAAEPDGVGTAGAG